MILDTSAVISILRAEPDAPHFAGVLEAAQIRRISAANYLEACLAIDGKRDPIASRDLNEFFRETEISIEPVTETQAKIAREAYRDFGRGSGHPAKLNFGDCFAYALAKDLGEPLLFKGTDFSETDVAVAS